MATAVPTKGSTGRFSIDKILEFVEEVGDTSAQIIIKSDQELAIRERMEAVQRERLEDLEIPPEASTGWGTLQVELERAIQSGTPNCTQ